MCEKKEAGVCLKTETSGRSFRVNARWEGGGWPSKWFLRFVAYYFEVAVPFFRIVHHHLPPPQNNLKIPLRQENCFDSTSGITTKYFVINLLEIILGWVGTFYENDFAGFYCFWTYYFEAPSTNKHLWFIFSSYLGVAPCVFAWGSPHAVTNSGNPFWSARQIACQCVSWLWGLPDAENLQWSAMVRIWFSDICQTCSCFCVFLAGDSRGLIGVEWGMIFDGSLMEQHYHDMITKSCRKGPRQPETQSSLDRRWNMYLGWSSLALKPTR